VWSRQFAATEEEDAKQVAVLAELEKLVEDISEACFFFRGFGMTYGDWVSTE